MSQPFKFKQFSVSQNRCAMKIGTDGVLLGAWTSIEQQPQTILDIGSGTGVIALQLAQRSFAETIDAIEIDSNAFEQCTENFENSPWGDRLYCYHASIQEFTQEIVEENDFEGYDLIVSNPPFYTDDYKSENKERDIARFEDSLPFQHLLVCASNLLTEDGVFSVVLPKKEENSFITLAATVGLFPKRICNIRGTETSAVKRSLMEFTFQQKKIENESLVIEKERHDYTEEYIGLLKDFYLKM
ncbi:tRNA1(Val) (adenine(37)-N6)-methyltransferase [Patiriisocius marinistellae]|uniref:tRNA1(Val) (adenine(37)-N6)-methyltransferase n=1 Tax=Patiriisocius marinistellae TaxID=2494560 RepID=A0A5J4FSZ9_9FLAO|nr:methyltransferase [Patiriisocius marinistellae]GEQ84553.1 tRNA1(Val) (adenine(37)-N6)-methyltransferase [Patiriisocius marinistellae]